MDREEMRRQAVAFQRICFIDKMLRRNTTLSLPMVHRLRCKGLRWRRTPSCSVRGKGVKMGVRKKQMLMILALSACLAVVSQSYAQPADLSRLREAIERNAELIREAELLVRETSSVKARASLETAMLLHRESLNLVSANRVILAERAVKKTREAALRAIALAKLEAKTEEDARNAIERAKNRLDQAKMLLEESTGREPLPVRKLTIEAEVQLRRAADNMREHLFAASLRLANSSYALSTRAIRLLRENATAPNEEVERELRRTERVLEQVEFHRDLHRHPAAESMYREARELQQRAADQFQSQHAKAALELTRRARSLALNAAKILASHPGERSAEQAIRLTENLLEQAKEMAEERDSEVTEKRLRRAEELQESAKSRLSEGDHDRALKLTLRARETIKRAIAPLEAAFDSKEVEKALRATDAIVERLKSDLERYEDQAAHELFERALLHQESAWSEFDRGRLKAALTSTKLARRLANRILERLHEERL